MKDYFGKGHGVNPKDHQGIDDSMTEAASFLTNGLSNYKKRNNISEDNEREIIEYKEKAKSAFDAKRMSEAATFYDKIIAMCPEDYDAKFYRLVISIVVGKPSKKGIMDAYNAYVLAHNNMPVEADWYELETEYAKQFADLCIAWFKTLMDKHNKVYGEWYSYNIKDYYEYTDNCKFIILFLNQVMPIILKSDISDYSKEWDYAWWYCRICAGHCDATLYLTVNNRDLAITSSRYCDSLGLKLAVKAPVIQMYDNMCFEVRKIDPDFEVCGAKDEDGMDNNEYGFDRYDPPTTYENQQTRNRMNVSAQIAKDREIAQKLAQWKSSGGREKDAREKRFVKYMTTHPDERLEYQSLKRDVIQCECNKAALQNDVKSLQTELETHNTELVDKTEGIQDNRFRIEKLQKKVLGKKKAQEKAEQLAIENDRLISESSNIEEKMRDIKVRIQSVKDDAETCERLLTEAQRKLELYMSNCLI